MNIILAYDGSECADKAIKGLRSAGIPDGAEVTVLSVSEWFPVPVNVGGSELLAERPLGTDEEALRLAEVAGRQLEEEHPTWIIRTEGCSGSPAHEIVRYADEQKADLIVTGSHGRSAIGRFFLGSVSHQVLTSAHCGVRISRSGNEGAKLSSPTIIIALDGSNYAEAIFETVLHRNWLPGTTFRIVSAAEYFDETEEEETMARLRQLHFELGEKLKEKGFAAESIINTEMMHPREAILLEAERTGAECIFLGARGLTQFERFVLGSVSIAVAMRADCSVEIVHRTGQEKSETTQ